MRSALLISLFVAFVACGDAGPRDRSRLATARRGDLLRPTPIARSKSPDAPEASSLAPDPLATYYAEDAELIVRFEPQRDLDRKAQEQLGALRAANPSLPLPAGSVLSMVRNAFGVPAGAVIDPVRPFALVRRPSGWVALLPTRDHSPSGRVKQLDALYSVAGLPARVADYAHSFEKGLFLPGDVSVIGSPANFARLGTLVGVPALDALVEELPKDMVRVDAALTLANNDVRLDIRAEAGDGTPTAHFVRRVPSSKPGNVRYLPRRGSLYFETAGTLADAGGLLENLLHGRRGSQPNLPAELEEPVAHLVRAIGSNAAAVVDLEPDGAGRVLFVSNMPEGSVTEAFFDSFHLENLLREIAGEGGQLRWKQQDFVHRGVRVGSITGHVSRTRNLDWQASGDYRRATLSKLLRGPVVVYVARVEGKLCISVGARARRDMATLLDVIMKNVPSDNDHVTETASLFPERFAAVTIDAAELFEGVREAAPYWHPAARPLRDLAAKRRVPVAISLTTEERALRVALRLHGVEAAGLARRIQEQLRTAK